MSRKILCIPGNDGITQYFASKIDEQGQITEYIVVGQMGGTIRGTEELFQKKRTIAHFPASLFRKSSDLTKNAKIPTQIRASGFFCC